MAINIYNIRLHLPMRHVQLKASETRKAFQGLIHGLPCRRLRFTNSSDSFTNLEFRIYEIYYDFLLNWQTEKNKLFWSNKKFVFFFNCTNWEKLVKQIGENIWWIRYLLSTRRRKISLDSCVFWGSDHYYYVFQSLLHKVLAPVCRWRAMGRGGDLGRAGVHLFQIAKTAENKFN